MAAALASALPVQPYSGARPRGGDPEDKMAQTSASPAIKRDNGVGLGRARLRRCLQAHIPFAKRKDTGRTVPSPLRGEGHPDFTLAKGSLLQSAAANGHHQLRTRQPDGYGPLPGHDGPGGSSRLPSSVLRRPNPG